MISPTQTMEHTTFDFTPSFKNPDDMPEYISIYDKPKRGRGRPKTCKLSDEEKRERLRINYKAYFNANPEKERERVRLAMARKRAEAKKTEISKTNYFFWLSEKMNFYLKT